MSIELKNISYTYMPKTTFEHLALDDISITIPEGKITAIAGHTGSGKSTLIQHFNGLLKPNKGTILVDGVDIGKKNTEAKAARRKVGIVFQYPEYQLFEETIAKDIAFGPRNIGCSEDETQVGVIVIPHVACTRPRPQKEVEAGVLGFDAGQAVIVQINEFHPRILVRVRNHLVDICVNGVGIKDVCTCEIIQADAEPFGRAV